jgi:hypothetical protein
LNQTLTRFHAEGFGKFTEYALAIAPFFKAIKPTVMALTETSATAHMQNPIETHIGSEHNTTDDAALCSLALFTGGVLADAGAPEGAHWTLKGFEIEYLKLRRFEVLAQANSPAVDWKKAGNYSVQITIAHGHDLTDVVATATLKISVTLA